MSDSDKGAAPAVNADVAEQQRKPKSWRQRLGARIRKWWNSNSTRQLVGYWWAIRGGWRSFFLSNYALAAMLLMVPTWNTWLYDSWWEQPIAVLPNVLGFSLGGYAILLALGDDGFRGVLAPKSSDPKKTTTYLKNSAIFLHFVLVQVLALLAGIIAKSYRWPAFLDDQQTLKTVLRGTAGFLTMVGYWLFLYALVLAAAASLSVFGLTVMFDRYMKKGLAENQRTVSDRQLAKDIGREVASALRQARADEAAAQRVEQDADS